MERIWRRKKLTLQEPAAGGSDYEEHYPDKNIRIAVRQLDEYFAGRRRAFDLPLLLAGTDFQVKVWNELLNIPFGETISYGDLAQRIGMPKAVRAVANANGANPLSVFVPCHRVVGSDRSLTGYGGGIEAKRRLLELEGVRLPGLSALWGCGEVITVAAENLDYSTPGEVDARIAAAVREGLDICRNF